MMFVDITEYLNCKYELVLNDKLIGKFRGHHEFKKLVTSYIRSSVRELMEKGTLEQEDMIIYSVRVNIKDFLDKEAELKAEGTPNKIPEYVNVGKYVRSIEKYMGKNLFHLLGLLPITIRK